MKHTFFKIIFTVSISLLLSSCYFTNKESSADSFDLLKDNKIMRLFPFQTKKIASDGVTYSYESFTTYEELFDMLSDSEFIITNNETLEVSALDINYFYEVYLLTNNLQKKYLPIDLTKGDISKQLPKGIIAIEKSNKNEIYLYCFLNK